MSLFERVPRGQTPRMATTAERSDSRRRESAQAVSGSRSAGILLGIGLGGFVDGIVLHQILQWHHMLTR